MEPWLIKTRPFALTRAQAAPPGPALRAPRLRHQTRRARASELISIAHPDFRAERRREATHLF